LDPVHAPAELSAEAALIWAWLAAVIPRLASALIVAVVGYIAARWIAAAVAQLFGRAIGLDVTLLPSIKAFTRYAIIFFVVLATLGQLGVQTISVVAAVGAIGLAIGLALQGTLSNIAAGIMLLWLRPFRLGDYIETTATSGSVREIGLFATEIETFDGIFRFVPNSALWNTPLTNYTHNANRLFNLTIGIKLEDDAAKASQIVKDVLGATPALSGDEPQVFIDSMADGFTYIGVRAWLPLHGFWTEHRDLVGRLKAALDGAGIIVQRMIHATPDIGDSRFAAPPPTRSVFNRWSPMG